MGQQSSIQVWKPFEMVVDTTIAGSSGVGNFKIETDPLDIYRYKVEWGDGSISATTSSSDLTHTYPSGGTYTIKISGRFDAYQCNNSIEADKIISINSWGNVKWKQFSTAFRGCANLTGITSDAPTLESLNPHTLVSNTSFNQVFEGCTNLDVDLGSWDMSKVTSLKQFFYTSSFNNNGSPNISGWTTSTCIDMEGMFNVTPFNQPIGSWDVSNVTNMSTMLAANTSFNQDLSNWDVSSVVTMSNMFNGSTSFNQDIGSWDTSNVEDMSSTFYISNFNNGGSPSISGWTTSACTNMSSVFKDNNVFNQPIGSWDVGNVNTVASMFWGTNSFNQDIGSWDVSNVETFQWTFRQCVFNNGGSPSIDGWTTSACTTMKEMFLLNNVFNQPIGSWDVSNVWTMEQMFNLSNSFDQDIGSWDVSSITTFLNMFLSTNNFNNGGSPSISGWTTSACLQMSGMFQNCDLFNQPIGSWDVSNVANMANMLNNTSISVDNYNDILTGWTGWDGTGATKTLQSNVTFGANGLNYSLGSAAEDAKNYLITGLTWTITDAGGV